MSIRRRPLGRAPGLCKLWGGEDCRPNFMIRTFLEEFVIPILLFVVVRSLIRGFFDHGRRAPARRDAVDNVPLSTELKKDPVCGTYVSAANGFTKVVKGQTVCFCSRECRDRYTG